MPRFVRIAVGGAAASLGAALVAAELASQGPWFGGVFLGLLLVAWGIAACVRPRARSAWHGTIRPVQPRPRTR